MNNGGAPVSLSIVAGHRFKLGRCDCGMTWLRLLDNRARWEAGEDGLAHVGHLNAREVQELNDYAAEQEARIWDATVGRRSWGEETTTAHTETAG